jgi:hypothetical protein
MVAVNVKGVDELAAVIPHLLGFQPTESLVVVPLSPGPPVARIDLPDTADERDQVTEQLLRAYRRHAQPGSQLALMCFSENLPAADLASQQLAGELIAHGIEVSARLWVTENSWTELDSGQGGQRTREAQTLMAAELVVAGRRAPAAGRSELAAQLVGDRGPVAEQVPDARDLASSNGAPAERVWAAGRIGRFESDGTSFSDPDAARLLVALKDLKTRDDALMRITTENAATQRALWSDLTRRAPDELRAAPAALLGFSAWLGGDGAGAWIALDQIPAGSEGYPLAQILAQALEQAVPPTAWEPGGTRDGDLTEPSLPAQGLEAFGPRRMPDPPSPGWPDGPRSPPAP